MSKNRFPSNSEYKIARDWTLLNSKLLNVIGAVDMKSGEVIIFIDSDNEDIELTVFDGLVTNVEIYKN